MMQMANFVRGVLVTLFILLPNPSSPTTTCYYPNGNVASTYQPCSNPDGSASAACCELSSSACSTTGYCYGSAGVIYRGGCTDSSWNNVNCAAQCKDVNSGSFSNINLCPGTEHNTLFTCSGSGSFTIDMCQTNFTINAGVPFTPSLTSSTSRGTATITTTATASASSATCATVSCDTAQQSCSDSVRTVGLALGLPLGALLICLAVVILWQHRAFVSRPSPLTQSQGYAGSQYNSGMPNTLYGTGTKKTMSQQQQEWKPQGQPHLELQSHAPMYEIQS